MSIATSFVAALLLLGGLATAPIAVADDRDYGQLQAAVITDESRHSDKATSANVTDCARPSDENPAGKYQDNTQRTIEMPELFELMTGWGE